MHIYYNNGLGVRGRTTQRRLKSNRRTLVALVGLHSRLSRGHHLSWLSTAIFDRSGVNQIIRSMDVEIIIFGSSLTIEKL